MSYKGEALEAFADLPDTLVQDLLAKALPVAEGVNQNLQALRQAKASLHAEAERRDWIRRKADLDVPSPEQFVRTTQVTHRRCAE
jgi:hypothetical protein